MSQLKHRAFSGAAVMAGAATFALAAAPASAKTTTLHFFQKATSMTFLGTDGKPLSAPPGPNAPPAVGERFIVTDEDYVGSHNHHAKRFTATDHLACTFTDTRGDATCTAQIAIGGSMLLADDVKVALGSNGPTRVPINGGTGAFRHARGTTLSVTIGNTNNSDFTVTFTT